MKSITIYLLLLAVSFAVSAQTQKDAIVADSLIKKAIISRQDSSNNEHALQLAERARLYALRSKSQLLFGNSLIQVALAQKNLGKHDSAFYNLQQASTIFNGLDNRERAASVYNNMSTVKELMGDYHEGIQYARKASSLWPADSISKIARTYNNIANLFESIMQIDSAIYSNQQALELLKKSGYQDTSAWMDAQYGLGKRLISKGEYLEARTHINELLELSRLLNAYEMLGMGFEAAGVIELRTQKPEEAEKDFLAAENYYRELGDSLALAFLYENMGEVYAKKEDYQKAILMYQAAGSHYSGDDQRFRNTVEIKKELCEKNSKLGWRLNFILFLATLAAVGISIGIVLSNRLLSEKRKTYIAKEALLKAKEDAINEREKNTRMRHDIIKNNGNTVLTKAEAVLPSLSSSDPGYRVLLAIRRLVSKMLQKIDSDYSLAHLAPVTLQAFVEEIVELASDYSSMPVKLEAEIDDARNYRLNAQVKDNLEFIMENAFINIRKHANCSSAYLIFLVDEKGLSMTIKDDGKGFDTSEIKQGSNGLKNIRALSKEINGACFIESTPGKGTTIKITVPSLFAFAHDQ